MDENEFGPVLQPGSHAEAVENDRLAALRASRRVEPKKDPVELSQQQQATMMAGIRTLYG